MATALAHIGRLGGWYVVSSVIALAAGLAVLPLLTNSGVLRLSAFGRWGLVEGGVGIGHTLLGLQLGAALIRFYADAKRREPAISSAMWTTLLVGCAVVAIASLTTPLLELSAGLRAVIPMALAYFAAELVSRVPLALLRARELARRYAAVVALRHAAFVALVMWLVVLRDGQLSGLVAAAALSTALAAVVALVAAGPARLLRPQLSYRVARAMLRYSLPVVVEEGSASMLYTADRYLVAWHCAPAVVAPYILAVKLAGILRRTAVWPVRRALWPVLFRSDAPAQRALLEQVVPLVGAALSLAALAAVICAAPLIRLIKADPAYLQALVYLPWVAFGAAAIGTMETFHGVLALRMRTGTSSLTFAGAALLSLGCGALLVPHFGPRGAAVGIFVASTSLLAAQAGIAKTLFSMRARLVELGVCFVVSLVLALVGAHLARGPHTSTSSVLLHASLCAVWAVVVVRWLIWPSIAGARAATS